MLEPWAESRLEEFVRLAADPAVMRFVGAGLPWSRDKAERDFARSLDAWSRHGFGKRSLLEKESGDWIGFVEVCQVGPGAVEVAPDEVEIGWWLAPARWGRGLATEAARAARDDAFSRVCLERLIGRYQPANVASGRVMEKIDMRHERDAVGRHGEEVRINALGRAAWRESFRARAVG